MNRAALKISGLFLFAFSTQIAICQEFANTNWHFGSEIGIKLEATGPESVTSSIDVLSGVAPASISDNDGNLLFYTNGAQVWNADHNVIDNGVFSNLGLNNLFVPVPGNENRYYLFRSAEWGVDYSILDLTLDGGAGGIISDQKEVFFHDHMSELLATSKEESINFWVMLIDNDSGFTDNIRIQVFEMSSTDMVLSETYQFNYIFAGWYNQLDDAKLAPDCSKIATLHKGHYLSLFLFNNADGTVSGDFPNALDTQTQFTQTDHMEFSPSGDYLYVIGDYNRIDRFDLQTWNLTEINSSKTTVAEVGFSQTWRDIKLSPFGDLYVYNEPDNILEKVIDPDVSGTDVGVESTSFELNNTGSYFFPNTPNLSCVAFSQPSFFGNNVCLGDTTFLGFSFGSEVEEIDWDFGSESATTGPNDEPSTWAVYSEQGVYEITVELFYYDTWHTHTFTVSVGEEAPLELGEDVLLCAGETEVLVAPNDELYEIAWSTGESTASIEVTEEGTYSVSINNLGCVVSDTVDVDVIPEIPTSLEDIGQCDQQEPVLLDAQNSAAENYIWNTGEQTASIEVESTGTFWVTMSNSCFTVVDTAQVILVQFPESVLPEEVSICEREQAVLTAEYGQGDIEWNTGQQGPSITVSEPGQYSVVIDHANCITQDTLLLTVTPQVAVELEDYVFCEEGFAVLDATDPNATNYNWSTGSDEPQITVEESGTYWVEVSNACFEESDTSIIEVIVFPDPLLPGGLSGCFGDTISLTPAFTQGDFTWTTGSDSTTIQVTESGTYGVFIEYMGCVASDEVYVNIQDFYPLDELELPNVFTPNGDALNREFRLYYPEDPSVVLCNNSWLDADMTIFNRWGNRIHDNICSWNGNNSNGEAMSDGTYYYLVNLRSVCDGTSDTKQISGYVTLLR